MKPVHRRLWILVCVLGLVAALAASAAYSPAQAGPGVCTGLPDGSFCDDGNFCTAGDTCAAGLCVGGPSPCFDGNACTQDLCDPVFACSFPTAADGTGCSDSNPCTLSDQCLGGACASGPPGPPVVEGLLVPVDPPTNLVWDPIVGIIPVEYDVASGIIAQLRVFPIGTGPGETCLTSPGYAVPSWTDLRTPPPGVGYWYLVRAKSPCGTGHYGWRNFFPVSTGVCPP